MMTVMERNLKKRWLFFTLVLGLALTLSACGSRLGANSWPGVSVADDTVYVSAGPAMYALQLETGDFKWAFASDEKGFSVYAAPAISPDGQLIVVGDYLGSLYGLTPEGKVLWKFAQADSHYVASPLVTADGIYAPNADGALYALDLTGKRKWVFRPGRQPLWGTPVTDGERLYVPSLGHHLYALDPADGSVVWDVDLGGSLASQPTLVDGVVYVGTFADEVVALDAASGDVLWRTPTEGWVWSAPAYSDGKLFVGDLKGNFFAINAEDGTVVWKETPDGSIVGQPLVHGDTVYFTTEEGLLIAYSLDGKPLWQHIIQGKLYAQPIWGENQDNQLILVAPYKGDNVVVAATPDGKTKWALSVKTVEEALKASDQK